MPKDIMFGSFFGNPLIFFKKKCLFSFKSMFPCFAIFSWHHGPDSQKQSVAEKHVLARVCSCLLLFSSFSDGDHNFAILVEKSHHFPASTKSFSLKPTNKHKRIISQCQQSGLVGVSNQSFIFRTQ